MVSFHDYDACGISVLAPLAARGDAAALRLVRLLRRSMEHYRDRIHGREVSEHGVWNVPLRRSLLHVALAWRSLRGVLDLEDEAAWCGLVEQQVPAAIRHCRGFQPGRKDLHLAGVNNQTAIFMQGIWHCGREFGRPEWTDLAREFAERNLASGHPDGYYEEHTNADSEGGPSLVYTPLPAGCLYDVLGGRDDPRREFLRAGAFFCSFLDPERRMIPLADERTYADGPAGVYGLALHSLSAEGRAFVAETLDAADWAVRIGLPLGILRGRGFTAGLSALRALNRDIAPESDYALDRQAVAHLSHAEAGTLVSAVKSKRDPGFSTFRIGEDAYPVRTGTLEMGADWAEARLAYRSFGATARWELSDRPLLILSVDTDAEVKTSCAVADPAWIHCGVPFEKVALKGFSPYSRDNLGPDIPAVRFRWKRELRVSFARP